MPMYNTKKYLHKTATGKLSATLTNDLLFHYMLQKSNHILKNLICSLKGLDDEDVKEVVITNPIDYAGYVRKELILDVKVVLNDAEILDIELQMYHDRWWKERSMFYMCRSFDSLESGDDYGKLKTTTFVGIIDEDLFPKHPEFYSTFAFLHEEKHYLYSSKLKLNMLYLNRVELATEQDKRNKLDYWAKLFKSNTWEELNALAEQNPIGEEVAEVMYEALIQSPEKTMFEAHQKYLFDLHSLEAQLEKAREELDEKDKEIERLKSLLQNNK